MDDHELLQHLKRIPLRIMELLDEVDLLRKRYKEIKEEYTMIILNKQGLMVKKEEASK